MLQPQTPMFWFKMARLL